MKAEFRGTPQLSCPALPLSPGPALLLGTLPGHSATRPTPHVCTAECCHSAGDARMDQPSPKPCPSPGRCTPSSTDPQSTATKAQQEPSHSAWQRALSPSSPTQCLHGTEPRPQRYGRRIARTHPEQLHLRRGCGRAAGRADGGTGASPSRAAPLRSAPPRLSLRLRASHGEHKARPDRGSSTKAAGERSPRLRFPAPPADSLRK